MKRNFKINKKLVISKAGNPLSYYHVHVKRNGEYSRCGLQEPEGYRSVRRAMDEVHRLARMFGTTTYNIEL